MHKTKIVRDALRHVALKGADAARALELAESLWLEVVREPAGFQGAALARLVASRIAGKAPGKPVAARKARWTLTDLVDPAKLAEWLAYDGNPPEFMFGKTLYSPGNLRKVTDKNTAEAWWDQYTKDSGSESRQYIGGSLKRREYSMMHECFKALGITKGSIEERRKKAIELRPDLYSRGELAETGITIMRVAS